MAFDLPKLKYSNDALEPYLSERTVSVHYNKHTAKYFDVTNKLIKGTVFEKMSKLEDMLSRDALVKADSALFNNASQAWNHVFYFEGLAPKDQCGEPSEELLAAITDAFGGMPAFKEKMTEVCVNQFGSGWGWLILKDGKLIVKTTPNAGNPLSQDRSVPLMCIDVWEHAYYLDYENKRDTYVGQIWNIIDWNTINERYTTTTK